MWWRGDAALLAPGLTCSLTRKGPTLGDFGKNKPAWQAFVHSQFKWFPSGNLDEELIHSIDESDTLVLVLWEEKVQLWKTSARFSQHGKPLFKKHTISANVSQSGFDQFKCFLSGNWKGELINLISLSLDSTQKFYKQDLKIKIDPFMSSAFVAFVICTLIWYLL